MESDSISTGPSPRHQWITVAALVTLSLASNSRFFAEGQMLILPELEVDDPFKSNPKWEEFLFTQVERMDRLHVLVNNVWRLIDAIPNPSPESNLNASLVKFHIPDFIEFFKDPNDAILIRNPFPFTSTAIGFHDMSSLINTTKSLSKEAGIQSRLTWLALEEASFVVHNVFNKISKEILNYGNESQEAVLELSQERFPIWSSAVLELESSDGYYTLDEITKAIDQVMTKEAESDDGHLLRQLLDMLSIMRQSHRQMDEWLNYFCYGNNEFGVVPDILDIIKDAATFFVTMDMKKLVLDVYVYTFNIFFNSEAFKDSSPAETREKMWKDMRGRIERKIYFPLLEGNGWPYAPGPLVFKCDQAPKNFRGERGQWGRNISTGESAHASPTFPFDPEAGPLKQNETVGYADDRVPDILAVGFQHSFTGYIESELALDPISSCRGTCPEFMEPTPLCRRNPSLCPLFRQSHCNHSNESDCLGGSQCRQFAMKCQRIGREVKICPAEDPSKLYNWIGYDERVMIRRGLEVDVNGMVNSNEPICKDGVRTAVEGWQMENGVILNTPRYCELCLCTCTTPFYSKDQEYFDLEPVLSNVKSGMIVTAIRFVKHGQVIGVEIEEGKPVVRGLIEESTRRWVPKSETEMNETVTPSKVPLGFIGFVRMNFDLIIGEPGTIVTGIRFQLNETERSLNLEIQTTPILWPEENPNDIKLQTCSSKWLGAIPSPIPREPLEPYDPGDPMIQNGPSMPDSVLNSYVEFTSSSYERDLGQTVIPFFDAQPVFYNEGRRWLRGAGVMHKGKTGSGGFIALSIVPAEPYKTLHYHSVPNNETASVA